VASSRTQTSPPTATALQLTHVGSQEYSYDDASQLTGITYRFSGATMGDLKYAYDDAGKRTAVWGSYARTKLPDSVASLNYDNSNRLIGRAGKPLEYDLAGNMTKDAETPRGAYTWNARGELMSISGGHTASFNYDAFGRRVAKTVGGKRTDYVHDGSQVVQERTGVGTANLLAGLEADELYARDDASGTTSLLTDALGSTIALTDAFGFALDLLHLRPLRKHHPVRPPERQPMAIHRPRERRHRPLPLSRPLLPPRNAALHLRRPDRTRRRRHQPTSLRWREPDESNGPIGARLARVIFKLRGGLW
jgi:YD repeat-containing protein